MSSTDTSSEPAIAIQVVNTVCSRLDADPCELPPLNNTLDPEGLNRLCASGADSTEITFQYAGFEVTDSGSEDVDLSEITE